MKFIQAFAHGFTLVEMAVVLAILALLLSGGLTVLSAQIDQQKYKDTGMLLADAREALIGYAASHTESASPNTRPYLPCPDKTGGGGAGTANDGLEDRTPATGACVVQEGNIPWVTLGITDVDSWANHLRYRVTPAFSNSISGIQLTAAGTLTVNSATGTALASNVPAIILSHGKNGYGAINSIGITNQAPTGANELENTNGNDIFISNPLVGIGGTGGEFDDLLVWLSPNILFNRMIQSGKLP